MLYFKPYGIDDTQKPNLLILHGLFGSSTNWHSMAGKLAAHFNVYNIDIRNHGRSAWHPTHTYPELAADIVNFISEHAIENPSLLGHSMGGKVAMQLTLSNPELIQKLVVADIAPVSYPPRDHGELIEAMSALDLTTISSRKEADIALKNRIPEASVRHFLLQNLTPSEQANKWKWRLNLPILLASLPDIMAFPDYATACPVPTLFIYGKRSDYLTQDNQAIASKVFSHSKFHGVDNAGHWLHAEQPDEFLQTCTQFLTQN